MPESPHPQERIPFWTRVVSEQYGGEWELGGIGGSEDWNFAAQSSAGELALLKVMHVGCPREQVEMQVQALARVSALSAARVLQTVSGASLFSCADAHGEARWVWMQTRLPGRRYAEVRPHAPALLRDVAGHLAAWLAAFRGFEHPALDRPQRWSLLQAGWIESALDGVTDLSRRTLVESIAQDFRERLFPALQELPQTVIHGDANDFNWMVEREARPDGGVGPWRVSGLVDLGDMHAAPVVCELAVCATYLLFGQRDPLRALADFVAAFHKRSPLTTKELDLILPLIRLRCAMSVLNSAQARLARPSDSYVVASEIDAWELLENSAAWEESLVSARLRVACGLPAFDHAEAVLTELEAGRGHFANVFPEVGASVLQQATRIGLGVQESAIPRDPRNLTESEALHLIAPGEFERDPLQVGYYLEPRLVYTEPAYRSGAHEVDARRTVHIGVDLFAPPGTQVAAPLRGTVFVIESRPERLDYGAVVLLRHELASGEEFFTLYGHLAWDSLGSLREGQVLAAGEVFAKLGTASENGGWTPHLHFQYSLTTRGLGQDWPAVCVPGERDLWAAICPNPAALLNLPDAFLLYAWPEENHLLARREQTGGGSVRLSYSDPVAPVRGFQHYLYDAGGRAYLDAYNNVPHVGHAHPRIEAVYRDQAAKLNTNTRYLQGAQADYAERLLSRMPSGFTRCFLVNSGSEANELALRLVRAATGARGMLVQDHAYHGNTVAAIDLSPYKFDGPGGAGKPDWVAVCQVADPYRGPFGYEDPGAGEKYAADADRAIAALQASPHGVAGVIMETFPSVGGQIIPPAGYLAGIYRRVRAAGGLCIADEVQTGMGRLGSAFWGFEVQEVVPDIVVLGKPIGNGHPLGVVLTTDAIAAAFDNGMEFFSTFGGSTLSSRIGSEVFDIVHEENLPARAERVGALLLAGLRRLQDQFEIIGDVRGMGLFLGVELVVDRISKTPAAAEVSYVVDRLRELHILIGSDGPFHNVLKIRPPLTFEEPDAEYLLQALTRVLSEFR